MHRFWALSLLLLVLIASLTLACGSGNGRQLQSITISQTVNAGQVQFTATGTFSAPPTTVTPLPVSWGIGGFQPPPKTLTYTLTTQPFVFDCPASSGQLQPVSVLAPLSGNAPMSGTLPFSKIVTASASIQCPQ